MNILLDTNIVLNLSKATSVQPLTKIVEFDYKLVFISVVSIAELKSIALQNNWGVRRWEAIDVVLDKVNVVEMNEAMANVYAAIDAFSQRRSPSFARYPFSTPRNMGKNDLWIVTTAALLGLKLITSDADFDHLNGEFIDVQFIKPEKFGG